MRIVQTLWSAKQSLLSDSFGWAEPQYHLMSWALSCLSLRENYDEVVLYTDSNGYKALIEQLKLPYTDVVIQYDDLACPRHQWAYAKLQTYSLQEKPFLHVDGDVYLPKKLDMDVEQSGVIAQNREIGTEYYKKMVDKIQSEKVVFPDFLRKELQKESISSYNAGVLGGNDIEFIQKYCQTVFDYINANQLFNPHKGYTSHNILFEQILFCALAAEYNKEVATVLRREVNDNGYSYFDFCNFYSYENRSLMHIIGEHKKFQRTCELLSRTLLKKYPEYYQRIVSLFPEQHKRFEQRGKGVTAISSYLKYLDKQQRKWRKISNDVLLDLEQKSSQYLRLFDSTTNKQHSFTIKRNPYLSIYEKQRTDKYIQSDMALIPSILNDGFQEVPIDDLGLNILILLSSERSFEYIQNELRPYFQPNIAENSEKIKYQIREKMEYLFYNKLIYLNTID